MHHDKSPKNKPKEEYNHDQKYTDSSDIELQHTEGTGEFVGEADTRGKAQGNYDKIIEDYERNFPDRLRASAQGPRPDYHGHAPGEVGWAAAIQREAMKNNYMDYYYDGEAQALRCDTISFLILEKGKLDHYFVDCINNGDEHGAEKTLKEINRLTKRVQTELNALCK